MGFGHFPPFFIPGLPGDDQSPSLSLSLVKHHRKGCPKPSGLELHPSKPTACQHSELQPRWLGLTHGFPPGIPALVRFEHFGSSLVSVLTPLLLVWAG